MTTTSTWQGIDTDAKPSSRVLAPPGGGSSFSLFGPPEPTPNTNNSNNEREAAVKSNGNNSNSEVQQARTAPAVVSTPPAPTQMRKTTDISGDGAQLQTYKKAVSILSNDSVMKVTSGAAGLPSPQHPQKSQDRIFGDCPPPTISMRAEHHGDTKDRLFGGDSQGTHHSKEISSVKEDRSHRMLAETRNSCRVNKEHSRGTFNPITGESISVQGSASDSSAMHTSTRIRQPPGGVSSKLW